LAREHVRAVELAGDNAIEQHLPVGLRLERYEEPFVLEVTELVRNRERRHVRELDESELELVPLERRLRSVRRRACAHRHRRHERSSESHCCVPHRLSEKLETKKNAAKSTDRSVTLQRRCWNGPNVGPVRCFGSYKLRAKSAGIRCMRRKRMIAL